MVGTFRHLGQPPFAQSLPFDESYEITERQFGFLQSFECQPLEKLVLEVEDQLPLPSIQSGAHVLSLHHFYGVLEAEFSKFVGEV
jgi:hypothetical protein